MLAYCAGAPEVVVDEEGVLVVAGADPPVAERGARVITLRSICVGGAGVCA